MRGGDRRCAAFLRDGAGGTRLVIVARLRLLREMAAHGSMLRFRIGERVRFHPEGRSPVTGVITRCNKKTVSLLTENGQRWTVAPELLERARPRQRE